MRNVLITGCSSGLGLEATVACARRGMRVFATMRNLGRRGALDEAVAGAGVGERVVVLQLDVDDPKSIDRAIAEVLQSTDGALDGVVHNAGVSGGGAFEDLPEEEWRRIMETNFFGVLALTQAVLPAMRERRSGRIVCVSSNAAFGGTPGLSIYTASKWALEGWAESLAFELEPFGIQVVLVEPGAYRTEIWESSPRIVPPESAYAGLLPVAERTLEKVVGRARPPREVARVIVSVLTAPRPRLRYPVGPDAKLSAAMRTVLPYRARAFMLRRYTGLDRWRP